MDVAVTLGLAGTFLSVVAAWVGVLSPRAKARKAGRVEVDLRRSEAIDQAREVHEALYGTRERRDNSGALVAEGHPGVLADMRVVMHKLNAPILNGKGEDLIKTVDRLDGRSARLARRVGRIEKRLDESASK